jgi:hypothetical protein
MKSFASKRSRRSFVSRRSRSGFAAGDAARLCLPVYGGVKRGLRPSFGLARRFNQNTRGAQPGFPLPVNGEAEPRRISGGKAAAGTFTAGGAFETKP